MCLTSALALALTATAGAQAPDRQAAVSEGAPFSWSGEPRSGVSGNTALTPYPGDPGACQLPHEQCDRTLLQVLGEPRRLRIDLKIDPSDLPSPFGHDIDLYVYASDSTGRLGPSVASSENSDSEPETVVLSQPRGWYLVHAVWAWAFESGFDAIAAVPVSLPPSLPPSLAVPPPSAALSAAATLEVRGGTVRSLMQRGLAVRVACPAACGVRVDFVADARDARRLRLRRPLIAGRRAVLEGAGVSDLALRPTAGVRRKLRRAARLRGTVRAIVRDAEGLERTQTQRVALRRG